MKTALFACLLIASAVVFLPSAESDPIFRIEVGSNYESYSNDELKRRVWHLEKAVWQMQQRIYHLEAQGPVQQVVEQRSEWTCYLRSFGKAYTHTAASQTKARAEVIRQCSQATNAMHCDEEDVTCGE